MDQKPKRILRITDVIHKVGMPRSSVYRAASLGEFPKPIKLGEKASGWLESDVDAWIDSRVAASRTQ
ncbi:AlpA family transcriptional regulator [Paraburkholderia sp. RL18-103-BIB-C]|jgi:prophage regulatory protein|uniref:helix-turn-helix transcriptional regulator n=1 Tax=unclassified Paraburkholderia TaxID=2615204 RepID=UPI0038B778C2